MRDAIAVEEPSLDAAAEQSGVPVEGWAMARAGRAFDPRLRYLHRSWYRTPFLVPAWDSEELDTLWAYSRSRQRRLGSVCAEQLQDALQQRFGFPHVVLTSTGSCAIEVALRSLGPPGGEVILPSFLCGTVARAVLAAGCVPVFADIHDDLGLSIESVRRNLTDKTVAVLVAHLAGQPCRDVVELESVCRERGLALIDDAAQSLGASLDGRFLGSLGTFGALSFGLGKPTFSIGGGALVLHTHDAALRCRAILGQMEDEGAPRRHEMAAAWSFVAQYCWRRVTYPMYAAGRLVRRLAGIPATPRPRGVISELEAALQLIQLKTLDGHLRSFAEHGSVIVSRLAPLDHVRFPQASRPCGYTKLFIERRDGDVGGLATHLLKHGVEIEWPWTPLDLREEFSRFRRQPNVVAEQLWKRLLILPSHPALTPKDVDRIAGAVASFVPSGSR